MKSNPVTGSSVRRRHRLCVPCRISHAAAIAGGNGGVTSGIRFTLSSATRRSSSPSARPIRPVTPPWRSRSAPPCIARSRRPRPAYRLPVGGGPRKSQVSQSSAGDHLSFSRRLGRSGDLRIRLCSALRLDRVHQSPRRLPSPLRKPNSSSTPWRRSRSGRTITGSRCRRASTCCSRASATSSAFSPRCLLRWI